MARILFAVSYSPIILSRDKTRFAEAYSMLFDQTLFNNLIAQAAMAPRRRAFLTLHQSADEPVQRMLVAMQPDSYVPPHQHTEPHQWELLLVLAGQLDFLQFSPDGELIKRDRLGVGQSGCGLELVAGAIHSVVAVDGPAVFLEVKQGPYNSQAARLLPDFAPAEHTEEAGAFLLWMQTATIGQRLKPGVLA